LEPPRPPLARFVGAGALLGAIGGALYWLLTFSGTYTPADRSFWGPLADLTNALFGGVVFVLKTVTLVVYAVVGAIVGAVFGGVLAALPSPRARARAFAAVLVVAGICGIAARYRGNEASAPPAPSPPQSSVPVTRPAAPSSPPSTPDPARTVEPLPRAAARLLGSWLYPNARMVRYPLAPGDTNYSTFAFYVRDEFPAVVAYYQGVVSGGVASPMMYRAEGYRPGDGRAAVLKVVQEPNGVYVRVDLK
jgi:hypothetical protein